MEKFDDLITSNIPVLVDFMPNGAVRANDETHPGRCKSDER